MPYKNRLRIFVRFFGYRCCLRYGVHSFTLYDNRTIFITTLSLGGLSKTNKFGNCAEIVPPSCYVLADTAMFRVSYETCADRTSNLPLRTQKFSHWKYVHFWATLFSLIAVRYLEGINLRQRQFYFRSVLNQHANQLDHACIQVYGTVAWPITRTTVEFIWFKYHLWF